MFTYLYIDNIDNIKCSFGLRDFARKTNIVKLYVAFIMDCVFVNTIKHIIEIAQPTCLFINGVFLGFHITIFLCLQYLKIYKTEGKIILSHT